VRTRLYVALEAAGPGRLRVKEDPIVFHDLRHPFRTLAVQALPLSDVKAMMGHADISTTMSTCIMTSRPTPLRVCLRCSKGTVSSQRARRVLPDPHAAAVSGAARGRSGQSPSMSDRLQGTRSHGLGVGPCRFKSCLPDREAARRNLAEFRKVLH
jgi:hypothetical protein